MKLSYVAPFSLIILPFIQGCSSVSQQVKSYDALVTEVGASINNDDNKGVEMIIPLRAGQLAWPQGEIVTIKDNVLTPYTQVVVPPADVLSPAVGSQFPSVTVSSNNSLSATLPTTWVKSLNLVASAP